MIRQFTPERCQLYFSSLYEQEIIVDPKANADGQLVRDYMTHVKVFNKCYLDESNATMIEEQRRLSKSFVSSSNPSIPKIPDLTLTELEAKVFPWLSQKSPKYEYNNEEYTLFNSFEGSFLKSYQTKLSGKGIVVTISNTFGDDCIRLIHTLRFLNNTLPIQLIHTEAELSNEVKNQIKRAGTDPFHNYPQQRITFVNVTPAIQEDYSKKFQGVANKILATMFNSFEEMMLIDADTVLAKAPETFFEMPKYRSSGTLFFRDRAVPEIRSRGSVKFFMKLMSSQADEILFGLNPATSKTLNLPFFSQRLNHMMESGVVLSNRNKHYGQPVIMANMNFFSSIESKLHGEKEMFWLSLAITGDENFEFNTLPAAAIGEITPISERGNDALKLESIKGKEVCSNHPAHINDADNHSLLWFNSGFKFCGRSDRVNLEHDFKKKLRFTRFTQLNDFKTFFETKLIIKTAIIPPPKVLTVPLHQLVSGEPSVAWRHMPEYCDGYTWCAYSSVGKARESKGEVGTIIEYSHEEVAYFKTLGDIWMSDFDYR
ncbi:putative alpha-13-mannosyltransferase MNN14 [Spathaspora sp. JA1]|nr:putative alpha-13-mannosyltransferase MNN14 [Spathaspora sp. JA1]